MEEPGGGSTSVEEPQEDTSADAAGAQRDDTSQPWYAGCEPGGGPASAEVPQAEPEEDPSRIPEDDTMDPQVVADWERDHGPAEDEYLTDHATGSFSATYPWMLYDTGVFCARLEYGSIDRNKVGEKVIILREWNYLLTNQRIALRRQGISRVEWERLPWTGHVCYLFTRAWECCRYRSKLMRDGRYDACATFLEKCREPCTDWLRGEHPPRDFENRGTIDQDQWSENWKIYSTNLKSSISINVIWTNSSGRTTSYG